MSTYIGAHMKKFLVLACVAFCAFLSFAQDILPVRWQQPGAITQQHMMFSADGNYMLTWNPGRPGMVTMRDGISKKVLWQYAQTSVVGASFYNFDAGVLVSSDLNTFRLDRQTGRVLGPWDPYGSVVGFITNVSGTNTVITSRRDAPSEYRSAQSGVFRTLPFTFASAAAAKEIVVSPSGRVAAAQGKIVDLNTGSILSTYEAGSPLVFLSKTDYVYSPGEDRLVRRKTDGTVVWDRNYYFYREFESDGEALTERRSFIFRTLALKNSTGLMAGGGTDELFTGPGDYFYELTALVWNVNPENGDLSAIAVPAFINEYNTENWDGFVTSLTSAVGADRYAFQYRQYFQTFYSSDDRSPQIYPLASNPSIAFPAPFVPDGRGFSGVVSPPPLGGESGKVTFVTPGPYNYFYTVSRQTGLSPVQLDAYYLSIGATSPMSVSWDSTMFACTSTTTGSSASGYVIFGRNNDQSSEVAWFESARSAPVFVGSSVLAFTEGGTTVNGRLVKVSSTELSAVNSGSFPGTETPIAGRRDGSGLATMRDGVISYFNLTGTGPITTTLKGTFPSFKKAVGDVVLRHAATFTSGDNLAIVVAVRRAGSLKTDLEYRLVDVKSSTMRTLESRTLTSYSNTWQSANFLLALSRDGAQAAVLLDRLTIEGGNVQGYVGQVDFVRTSDGIFNGRFSNQQIGWGFLNAYFTSDTRSLAVTRRDGTSICFAVPPQLYAMTAPTSVTSGSTFTVNVTLRGAATPGGTLLRVSYPNGNITGPGVVVLPDGATTGSFTVTATGAAGTVGDIRAYIGTDVKVANVNIN